MSYGHLESSQKTLTTQKSYKIHVPVSILKTAGLNASDCMNPKESTLREG